MMDDMKYCKRCMSCIGNSKDDLCFVCDLEVNGSDKFTDKQENCIRCDSIMWASDDHICNDCKKRQDFEEAIELIGTFQEQYDINHDGTRNARHGR